MQPTESSQLHRKIKAMENTEFEIETQADIIAQDVDGKIVLLVKVSTDRDEHNNVIQLISTWKALRVLIPFAMFVDMTKICIYKQQDVGFPKEPIKSLETVKVLRHYDGEFDNKQILKFYLVTLVEAWLRDSAYHWKSEKPPASEQLEDIGLLPKLEGGTTQSEVDLEPFLLKPNDQEVLNKIKNEIVSTLYEREESSLKDVPDQMQAKIIALSEKILNVVEGAK